MIAMLLLVRILLNTATPAGPDVYICNNKITDKYHNSSTCRGLSNCQFKIVKITVASAKAKKMTLCGWESKNRSVEQDSFVLQIMLSKIVRLIVFAKVLFFGWWIKCLSISSLIVCVYLFSLPYFSSHDTIFCSCKPRVRWPIWWSSVIFIISFGRNLRIFLFWYNQLYHGWYLQTIKAATSCNCVT